MQLYNDMGRLGLGSRLKRISDRLIQDVNDIYQSQGIDLEASCFPLLFLISRDGPISLRIAEAQLGTSQPLISQKAKILQDRGLISLVRDPEDGRARQMSMTEKGQDVIAKAQPIWHKMDQAMANLLHPHEATFFRILNHIEEELESENFVERTL
tara:strand:- start:138 stop:602 length:465 start_codon:yes stop_codon:yes gene_type:complete